MPVRRILALVWSIGAFLLMLWSWAFYTGPYLWAAEWQLEHFGAYRERLTFFVPLLVLLIPVGFIGGWGPLLPPSPAPAHALRDNARRNARIIALLGIVSLAVGAVAGGLGYQRLRTPPTHADLVLATGAEPVPDTDLARISGIARTDLIAGYQETTAGSVRSWIFVPLVAPGWRPGEPIRFLLKTNQTAWMPPPGSPDRGQVRMLQRDTPPFRMVTEPSVLKRYALPGIIQAQYDKARVPLDPAVRVAEQSVREVYAPYWIVATLGGLVGFCLLLASLLGWINAARARDGAGDGPGETRDTRHR